MLDEAALHQLASDLGADGIRRLVPKFVAETRERCARLRAEIDAGDVVAAHRDAHSLKSAARTYGAATLADAAMALEDALQRHDAAFIPSQCAAVTAAADEDLPALEAWLAQLSR